VAPEYRKSHIASKMADEVAARAKSLGITKMLGSVYLGRKGADANLEVLRRYGMRLFAAHDNNIFCIKDI
jgi:hypothetical protein